MGESGGKDISKILISAQKVGLDGRQLYDLLLKEYHLQMEMASGHYVTALTSVMDTDEGMARLLDALWEIDKWDGEGSKKRYSHPGGNISAKREEDGNL